MRSANMIFLVSMALTLSGPALAGDEPNIKIITPKDGDKLDAMTQHKLSYEVVPGAKGDHTHLYVDGKEAAILRQLKGSHTLENLAAGQREICIKIVNKGHTPIGVQRCIKVTVE